MTAYTTKGIVLTRTDFGEAGRIITFLTTDHGKVKAMAKGVRKAKAKLAGSVELFSVSDLTLIPGRGEIDTLISARLIKHYGEIVKDLERTTLGYEFLRLVNKATEAAAESAYFETVKKGLAALADRTIDLGLIDLWFRLQLLKISGHSPNLQTDRNGKKLQAANTYDFHMDHMHFVPVASKRGKYDARHIKFLRLADSASEPKTLQRVNDSLSLTAATEPLIETMLRTYLRL
ncbi:DNA repair protein RecO [Candidatus Saccharibacteria bacterium]|nr:DNA repair protein RecO [Candidatus Saccharibacteria bacterium]